MKQTARSSVCVRRAYRCRRFSAAIVRTTSAVAPVLWYAFRAPSCLFVSYSSNVPNTRPGHLVRGGHPKSLRILPPPYSHRFYLEVDIRIADEYRRRHILAGPVTCCVRSMETDVVVLSDDPEDYSYSDDDRVDGDGDEDACAEKNLNQSGAQDAWNRYCADKKEKALRERRQAEAAARLRGSWRPGRTALAEALAPAHAQMLHEASRLMFAVQTTLADGEVHPPSETTCRMMARQQSLLNDLQRSIDALQPLRERTILRPSRPVAGIEDDSTMDDIWQTLWTCMRTIQRETRWLIDTYELADEIAQTGDRVYELLTELMAGGREPSLSSSPSPSPPLPPHPPPPLPPLPPPPAARPLPPPPPAVRQRPPAVPHRPPAVRQRPSLKRRRACKLRKSDRRLWLYQMEHRRWRRLRSVGYDTGTDRSSLSSSLTESTDSETDSSKAGTWYVEQSNYWRTPLEVLDPPSVSSDDDFGGRLPSVPTIVVTPPDDDGEGNGSDDGDGGGGGGGVRDDGGGPNAESDDSDSDLFLPVSTMRARYRNLGRPQRLYSPLPPETPIDH